MKENTQKCIILRYMYMCGCIPIVQKGGTVLLLVSIKQADRVRAGSNLKMFNE